MTQENFFAIYLATIGVIGSLSAFVISHLLVEIRKLHERVDEIYQILLER